MIGHFVLIGILVLLLGCQPPSVAKPDFDFSSIKTVSVAPIEDYNSFYGSGNIVARSIVHHLMKLKFNVVERVDVEAIWDEAALSQSAGEGENLDLNLRSSTVIILCTITQFTDGHVIIIPTTKEDKGKTVTTITTTEQPVVIASDEADPQIEYETVTTEEITHFEGSTTETKEVEYIDSRVGIALQMIYTETGEVLWSNSYWYNALNLSFAVDRCVVGAVKPLKNLLK